VWRARGINQFKVGPGEGKGATGGKNMGEGKGERKTTGAESKTGFDLRASSRL
jgi:hypothetical protein